MRRRRTTTRVNVVARALRRALAALALAVPGASDAGQFAIHPMRLELGGSIRSGALAVRNDDKVPLSFQVRAMKWTQDEAGQDHYEAADDLIHFPRLMTLQPGQEGVVRVGLRQSQVTVEKAYRVFIEELPGAAPAPSGGPQVRVLVRFGAPVFVKPANPSSRLELEALEQADGWVRWTLRNTGNRHERFQGIDLAGLDAQGNKLYTGRFEDRYLLAGQARHFSSPAPPELCPRLVQWALEIKTDGARLERRLDRGTPSCP